MNWHRAYLGDPNWNWSFPEAFQPQYDFKTEWWWYGGHVYDGPRKFSFHAVLFRFGDSITSEDGWGRDVEKPRHRWVAQWAITDHETCEYLTGETEVPMCPQLGDGKSVGLSCGNSECGLHLRIKLSNPVLQGERGVTQKGPATGDASYHFSCPQSRVEGQIRLKDRVYTTRGFCWFDKECMSDAFGGSKGSWEWLSVSWNDGGHDSFYSINDQLATQLRVTPVHDQQFKSNLTAPYYELPCRVETGDGRNGWGFMERVSGVEV